MRIVNVPFDSTPQNQESAAFYSDQCPSTYHTHAMVSAGYAFFESGTDRTDYENRVLKEAFEIEQKRKAAAAEAKGKKVKK